MSELHGFHDHERRYGKRFGFGYFWRTSLTFMARRLAGFHRWDAHFYGFTLPFVPHTAFGIVRHTPQPTSEVRRG